MLFHDRKQAAGLLAERLAPYRGRRPLLLGLPRAGVVMAREMAGELAGDVDVLLVRKLRAPDRREIAIGAVTEDGSLFLPRRLDVPPAYVEEEKREALAALRSQRALYTPRRRAACPAGRIAIVVDDGITAGVGADAVLRALRRAGPARLIVAPAVAPAGRIAGFQRGADDVICLAQPAYFGSVSRFFMECPEVSDGEVVDALRSEVESPLE